MKKPIVIAIIVIALMGIIGWERFGQEPSVPISDGHATGTQKINKVASPEIIPLEFSNIPKMPSPPFAAYPDNRDFDTMKETVVNTARESQPLTVSITDEISPIHFIRSSTILGAQKPSKEEIDRLREAVARVSAALSHEAVIIDVDGLSTSRTPILLYGRDELDLSDPVRSVYDTLKKSADQAIPKNAQIKQD